MDRVRMVLIGGTSHVGKSTVARVVAAELGFEYLSTDRLARHPGRPWRTPQREVPPHVAEHYAALTVDELIKSVLDHYARLWPRIEELITAHADDDAGAGLVLEGSALWPDRVAELTVPNVGAAWLSADEAVLAARVRAGGHYGDATDTERHLMDKFLARSVRYQQLMVAAVDRLGLSRIDVGGGRTVERLAAAVLATVAAQAPGRARPRSSE